MLPQRFHDRLRQPEGPARLGSLGITAETDGPPHRDAPGVQVHVIPAERPGLLGADTGHQAQDHVGAEPGILGGVEDGGGLLGSQRLARPAGLTLRGVDQRGHVVRDMTVSLRVAQGPGQRVVRERHRPAGIACRHVDQGPAHVVRASAAAARCSPMTAVTSLRTSWLSLHRPGRPAVQPLGQPVVHGPLDRVGTCSGCTPESCSAWSCLSFSATSALVRPETLCRRHVLPSGP